ncbi:hypothetical protein HDV00_004963 [Rhizophlyctis rosea]|nr:hypothetical protein HDV00_004963 [Rhizophlyctis rosea]
MRGVTYTLLALAANFVPALGQANVTGNCVSGRMNFDVARIFRSDISVAVPPAPALPSGSTVANYDFSLNSKLMGVDAVGTLDFGTNGSVSIMLTRSASGAATGTKVSSTRYINYGKITARLRAAAQPGVVTTFITMSDRHDEIDWEIVGGDLRSAQSNVFYKGIQEFGVHGGTHAIPNGGSVADFHEWSIDGNVVRTLSRAGSTSPMTPAGEQWFPATPSLFQLSVWDGGSSDQQGTRDWAGGAIQWGSLQNLSAIYQYIDVQCYDSNDQPVPAWPAVGATNPAKGATINNTSVMSPNSTAGGHTVISQPTSGAVLPNAPGNKNAQASANGVVERLAASGSKGALAALMIAVLVFGI